MTCVYVYVVDALLGIQQRDQSSKIYSNAFNFLFKKYSRIGCIVLCQSFSVILPPVAAFSSLPLLLL